ncbi:MAG: carboxylesterase family protein [Lachnospiraceae bacterium]|nr:carboxylesterase family protein [Lachnospiraceae bacterium]
MLRETRVKNGNLKGLPGNDPRVTVYKGIPFAAPPLGDLRWHKPEPAPDWEGTLNAYTFGPISMQDRPGVGDDIYCREWHVDKDIPMDEDCLYLNVWTPAMSTKDRLPVLVWYFGGAFQWGYTAEMEFNGERLARRGIIVVSVNYRLQAFGFLAHPGLTAADPGSPANFGLLDQQAGLKWVYENIEAFGGDPKNITVAGQSAGGGSVLNQICDPENYGMIKGAVVLSGMIRFPGDDILTPASLEKACEKGEDFLRYLGASSINEARSIDKVRIRDAYGEYVKDNPRFAPVLDKTHYRYDPYECFMNNKRADIPVITGYTPDEFVIGGVNRVKESVHNAVKGALAAGGDPEIYVYEFAPTIPGPDDPGVFHSSDLWFWFETLNMCWRPFGGAHFELARRMCDCFADFVKYHTPNPPQRPKDDPQYWHPACENSLNIMQFKC